MDTTPSLKALCEVRSCPRAASCVPTRMCGAIYVYVHLAAPRTASPAPRTPPPPPHSTGCLCCAPQRHLSSFATERKLVRAQAATRARATPPAAAAPLPSITQPPPSSRHESPHALLNTRWRDMRRGTDAPPLLRAPAAQSRQVRFWRKRPTPHAFPSL